MDAQEKLALKVYCSDPDKIAQGLLNGQFVFDPGRADFQGGAWTLRYWRGDFYAWRDGCWQQVSDSELRKLIVQHIQKLNQAALADPEQEISITTQRVNNVMLCLMGYVGIPAEVEPYTWPDGRERLLYTITMRNGLLLLDRQGKTKPELAAHTPNFFGLNCLSYDFDPAAECPLWLSFLADVTLNRQDYVLLLQQWCGYLLRPDLREQKFLLCTGEGANGKGVLFDVIQALMGKINCSQVSLTRFANPFALYATLGKAVNCSSESAHIIEEEAESILKSFVAGDRFTFERKFREPISAVPTAKVMIATNSLPRFNDKTQAIWRRILLVPFDKTIEEDAQIKDLADSLIQELPGILNWAIRGLQKLSEAGGFTIPEHSRGLLEEYRKDADPCRAFLLEGYAESPDGSCVPCAELYRTYSTYCDSNGCYRMNNRTFGQQVRRIFPAVERVQIGGRDNREWTYRGLVHYVHQESLI
jgi:putative DNA primase/helicase